MCRWVVLIVCVSVLGHSEASELTDAEFYEQVLSGVPYLPANRNTELPFCAGKGELGADYKTVAETGIEPGWESRIARDWQYFSATEDAGKILVIDFARKGHALGYRYLSNNTQEQLYEPWSSSKVIAIAGALSKVADSVGPHTQVGNVYLHDLITSVHTYALAGNADGDSNAIATYFANVAGREYLTGLFHQEWLQLSNSNVRFRGAYGPKTFEPSHTNWHIGPDKQLALPYFAKAVDDPFYQGYRCETCGVTGNKPMTTLAQAEFLKRLVSHSRVPLTQLNGFSSADLKSLLYGEESRNTLQDSGGMQSGLGIMLSRAIAKALQPTSTLPEAKRVLDHATQGEWRIFQKLGAGPSETRGRSETVLLAHVCLPHVQGGREFTVAVQASVSGVSDALVGRASKTMQQILNSSMIELLNKSNR